MDEFLILVVGCAIGIVLCIVAFSFWSNSSQLKEFGPKCFLCGKVMVEGEHEQGATEECLGKNTTFHYGIAIKCAKCMGNLGGHELRVGRETHFLCPETLSRNKKKKGDR